MLDSTSSATAVTTGRWLPSLLVRRLESLDLAVPQRHVVDSHLYGRLSDASDRRPWSQVQILSARPETWRRQPDSRRRVRRCRGWSALLVSRRCSGPRARLNSATPLPLSVSSTDRLASTSDRSAAAASSRSTVSGAIRHCCWIPITAPRIVVAQPLRVTPGGKASNVIYCAIKVRRSRRMLHVDLQRAHHRQHIPALHLSGALDPQAGTIELFALQVQWLAKHGS